MHCKRSDTEDIRRLKRPNHCIAQESRSNPAPLPFAVNRQPGEQH